MNGNLVLSRKERESILIGNDITVTVIEVRGDKARISINAPLGVRILRSELAGQKIELGANQ